MNNTIIKSRGYIKVYTFTLILYLVWSIIFGLTNWNQGGVFWVVQIINKLMYYLIIFLLITVALMDIFLRCKQKLRVRHIVFFIVMIVLYFSYRNTNNTILLFAIAFISLGYGISFERLINIYYKTLLSILITQIIILILGMSVNSTVDFGYATGSSFGMYHPNNFAILLMSTIYAWGATKGNVKPYFVASISIFTGIVVYFLTASRTSSISIIYFGILILICELWKKFKVKKVLHLLRFAIVGVLALSVYLTFFYDRLNSNIISYDNNFIVRFNSGYNVYKQYGVGVFGKGIKLISIELANTLGVEPTVLDSAYVSLLLNHGLIATLLFFIYQSVIYKRLIKFKKYNILIIASAYLITGLMEQSVMMIQFNFTLFAGVTLLNENNIKELKGTGRK